VSYQIETRVDKDLSLDPSYIVHYQVTKDGTLLGDGIVEYNRQADCNDIPVSENLPPATKKQVQKQIAAAAREYINQLS
jgi:hypothetical protein